MQILTGAFEIRWRWFRLNSNSNLCFGPSDSLVGNVDHKAAFRVGVCANQVGSLSNVTGQWIYMRLVGNISSGVYQVFADRSPNRTSEVTVVKQGHMRGSGTIRRLMLKAADASGQVYLDDIQWMGAEQPPPPPVSLIITSPSRDTLVNKTPFSVGYTVNGLAFNRQVELVEGVNRVIIDSVDIFGRRSADTAKVTLDTQAPIVAITSPLNGSFTKEPASEITWTVDGIDQSSQRSEVLVEGPNVVTRSITDLAGNLGTASITINRDSHAPVVVLSSPGRDTVVGNSTFAISYQVDGVTGFNKTFTLVEGLNLLVVDSTDAAGNRGADTAKVTLDTRAPIVAITSPLNGSFTKEPASEIAWTVDGLDQSNQLFEVLTEGPNVVTRSFTDLGGNSGSASITINRDSHPPVVVISSPGRDTVVSASTITVHYTVDSAARSKTFSLAPGANVLKVDTTDAAGNLGKAEVVVTLDTIPPRISVNPVNHQVLADLSVPLKIIFSDSLSPIAQATLQVLLDGINITTNLIHSADSAVAVLSLSEGEHHISSSVQDAIGNTATLLSDFTCTLPPQALIITSPANLSTVRTADILVAGETNGVLTNLRIDGIPTAISGNHFETLVPLVDGRNTLMATATNQDGNQVSATLTVTLDREKPRIYITSPADSLVMREHSVTVSGSVSDRIADVQGQSMPSVKVNGIEAVVVNNTFSVVLPLSSGMNTITAVATDRAGNVESAVSHVTLDVSVAPSLTLFSGNNQSGTIFALLPQQLVVSIKNSLNQPVAGQIVLFHVSVGDGSFTGNARTLRVTTDADGLASVPFVLGKRAGPGANEVTAVAEGFAGAVVFHANAKTQLAQRILTASGDMQRGLAGNGAPHPLVAIVTDSASNPIPGMMVEFKVKTGGGHFQGQNLDSAITGEDGRAVASFTLGLQEGRDNNLVEASFAGNPSQPAIFVLSGYIPGPPSETKVSGVILDNSNQPLQGVTVRIEENGQQTTTNSAGQYQLSNTPVGNLHLHVDGTTATQPGDWVTLMFEVNAISGKNNDIGMPMYLVARNNAEGKVPSASTEQIITLSEIPGFSLKIPAGSATFPPDLDDHTITVTAVHADKIPMPPGEGMQPRFIVSIGPPQVKFDPPAPITFPNVNGLKPGEQTHFYSFDHDLGTYVSIGTGTVSEDGATMTSDKGFGIVKGGWHCGGPGNPTGTCSQCEVNVSVENPIVGMGEEIRYNATTNPENGSLSWSQPAGNSNHLHFDDVTCTTPGTFYNKATWNCNGGGVAEKSSFGICVGVSSVSTTCKYFQAGEALEKSKFKITTNPAGFELSPAVNFDGVVPSLAGGKGTGIVTIKAGTTSASTSVGIINPDFSETVSGLGWDKNALNNYLKNIEATKACSPTIRWSLFGTKSHQACNCEDKEVVGIGGSLSGKIAGCNTPSYSYYVPNLGAEIQVSFSVALEVTGTGSGNLTTGCNSDRVCGDISGSGTVAIQAAGCVIGTCDLIKLQTEGALSLVFAKGKLCYPDWEFSLPTIAAPTLTATASIIMATEVELISYAVSWDLGPLF